MKGNIRIVSTENICNQRGYLLLEMTIALSILFVLLSFVPLVMKMVKVPTTEFNHKELTIFYEQLGSEVRKSIGVHRDYNGFILLDSNYNQITYEQYGNRIVRRMNGSGFEIVLQNIDDFNYSVEGNTLLVSIHSKNSSYEMRYLLIKPYYNAKRGVP